MQINNKINKFNCLKKKIFKCKKKKNIKFINFIKKF